jgi:3-phenylpropionate/cinnamic acid dioxygenase small subunit
MPLNRPALDLLRASARVGRDLQQEIEQFLFYEGSLLDDHQLDEWLGLLADDIRYFMPLRRTLANRDRAREFSTDHDIAFYDDSKPSMAQRVRKYKTSSAWAEEPSSRTRHFVTNVRITPLEAEGEYEVASAFLVYRNRAEDQTDLFAGERIDGLRRTDTPAGFQLFNRLILLDQAMLMANNISFFF